MLLPNLLELMGVHFGRFIMTFVKSCDKAAMCGSLHHIDIYRYLDQQHMELIT